MDDTPTYDEQSLAHYSSPYYDPVKAHEYYERTKQLADKNARSALTSKEQRDTYAVARDSISKAKKAELTSSQEAQKAKLEALVAKAQAAVDQINSTLDDIVKGLVAANTAVKLNPIPADATPKQRAFIEQQNRQIKARAAKESGDKYNNAAGQAARDRARISNELSDAVKSAREAYSKAMDDLQAKYQNIADTEKQNIHDQVAGYVKPPPKKKARGKAKAKRKSSKKHKSLKHYYHL